MSRSTIRECAWRAICSKGGKGTQGGLVARRIGVLHTKTTVTDTRKHLSRLKEN